MARAKRKSRPFLVGAGAALSTPRNLTTGAADRIREDVPRIAAGETVAPREIPRPRRADIAASVLRSYEGVYRDARGTTLDLEVRGGELRANDWFLIPISDRRSARQRTTIR